MQDFWDSVADARRVLVVTGAGISAPAGLPTYRDPKSTEWVQADLERMSHKTRYGSYLEPLWRHWWELIDAARAAEPTVAHYALTAWQRRLRETGGEMLLVTQNIDGLHQRAGAEVIEFHGTLMTSIDMRKRRTFPTPERGDSYEPPLAPSGGRKVRPDVVLFGERPAPAAQKAVGFSGSGSCLSPSVRRTVRP